MVGVCVPSRGLVFSRTMQSVIEGMQALNKVGIATLFFSSHDLPIPQAHNYCVESALQVKSVTKVLFIEEDNYIFPDAFIALGTSTGPITTLQYNDKNGYPKGIIHYNDQNEVIWAGLGATAIDRQVFETLGAPYFRTDTRYKITKKHEEDGKLITAFEEIEDREVWDEKENKFIKKKDPYKYGGLDIDFYTRARRIGFRISVLPTFKAHHFELLKLGEPHTNNGVHDIRQV